MPEKCCEEEPECYFVQNCHENVKQVDGDEPVDYSKEQVPCNSMNGWIF